MSVLKSTESSDELARIHAQIVQHPSNAWAALAGYQPLYTASPLARIVIVGQAPGRKAQESGIPWNDPSGVRLRSWLGVTDAQFYDSRLFSLLPMDFFYPGKGKDGDLPPRKDFAANWHQMILQQLTEVRLTILIGSYAQKHYLRGRAKQNLTETVRAGEEYLPEFFPVVHPSPLNFRWQANNPWFEAEKIPKLQGLARDLLKIR